MPQFRRDLPYHRPAFAMNGWIMFLFLVLIGVGVWNAYFVWQALPPMNSAYSAGTRMGVWFAPVFRPILVLGVSWLAGKIVSLMFGRSDDAGNVAAAVVLLSAIALYGFGIYTRLNSTSPVAAPIAAAPASTIAQPPSAPRTPAPMPASGPATPAGASATQPPEPASPPTPPEKAPSHSYPTPAQSTEPPATRQTIDAFAAELTASIDALAIRAGKVLPDLARQPPHDLTKIKSRRDVAASLRAEAAAVKTALDAASDQLTAKLESAGVSASEARSAAFKWSGFEFKTASRGFGAGALVRLADKAEEEATYVTDNFGKWTLDSKGEVKCTDFQMKSKIGSLHFFVKAEADRRQFIIDQLQGR